jgi:hypothetical protein
MLNPCVMYCLLGCLPHSCGENMCKISLKHNM